MKRKMKAILSYLMIFAMVISMLPAMSAKAEGEDGVGSAPTSNINLILDGGSISGKYTYDEEFTYDYGFNNDAEWDLSIKEGLCIESMEDPVHEEGRRFLGWMVCTEQEVEEGCTEYVQLKGTNILSTKDMLAYPVPKFDIFMLAQWTGTYEIYDSGIVTVTDNGEIVSCNTPYVLSENNPGKLVFEYTGDDEDLKFYGISVRSNGVEIDSIRADENGRVEYTITDDSLDYYFDIVTWNKAFSNEYMVYYEDMDGFEVSVDGNSIRDGECYTYEDDINLTFTNRNNGEEVNPYAIIVKCNEEIVEKEIDYDKPTYTYRPDNNGAIEIKVYWSELHYVYDTFSSNEKNEIVLEYVSDGAGSVSHVYIPGERSVTYRNAAKLAVPKGTKEIQFNVSGSLKGVRYAGDDLPLDNYYVDGVFTLQLNEESWTSAYFEFPNYEPGYRVNYESEHIQVTDAEGNVIEAYTDFTFDSSAENFKIKLSSKSSDENDCIYGICVHIDDQEKYIKNEGDDLKSMEYVIDDMELFHDISVIDSITPFDNEFMIANDEADLYSTTVNGIKTDAYEICNFVPGESITFGFEQNDEAFKPYAIEILTNGLAREVVFPEDASYIYTPETERGFRLRVYWTQEEYDFDNLDTEDEEVMVYCSVYGKGTVTPIEVGDVKSASYKGNTKIVVPKSETSVDIQVIPDEGEELLGIFVRGEEVPVSGVVNGIYTFEFDSNETDWYNLDFNFSGGSAGDDDWMSTYTLLDGNGGEVRFNYADESGESFVESGKLFNVPVVPGMKVGEFCSSIGLTFNTVEKECSELTGWKVYRSDSVEIDLRPADEELNFGDEDNKIILFDSFEKDDVIYNMYMSFINVELIGESMSTEDVFDLDGDKNYYVVANWEESHTPSDIVRENEVPETCTEDGYYEEVVYCADCSKELSREEVIVEAPGHKYPLPILYTIDKMATCTEGAVLNVRCEVCSFINPNFPEITTWELGHNHKRVVTKATTSKNGSIKYICDRDDCGHVDEDRTEVINKPSKMTLSKTTYVYNGKTNKPSVTITDSKGKKISSSNYTVSCPSSKNVGKYTVKVTFKGNYSGTMSASYVINPKGTSLSSVSKASKAFTAKWKKQSTQVTGYQIQYSTSKKFSGAKTVTVSSYKTTSKKVTKLKAKKTYYVRVRTYKTVGKTKFYSSWSTAKSVKTK